MRQIGSGDASVPDYVPVGIVVTETPAVGGPGFVAGSVSAQDSGDRIRATVVPRRRAGSPQTVPVSAGSLLTLQITLDDVVRPDWINGVRFRIGYDATLPDGRRLNNNQIASLLIDPAPATLMPGDDMVRPSRNASTISLRIRRTAPPGSQITVTYTRRPYNQPGSVETDARYTVSVTLVIRAAGPQASARRLFEPPRG